MRDQIVAALSEASSSLDRLMSDDAALASIESAASLMSECLSAGGRVFSCGNGGSMCDAMHFAEELTGRFRGDRPALAAVAISDPAHITCVANDFGYEHVFSRYVEAHGKSGDVLLAISTSGNSTNVLNAVKAAADAGMRTVALTGSKGSGLGGGCDIEIATPGGGYSDRVQELHIKVLHILVELIEGQVSD